MKKVLSILITMVMCISLYGCTSKAESTPSEIATLYFDAIKNEDAETIAKCYSGDTGDVNINDTSESEDALQKLIKEKYLDFDYTISNEVINDNKATADVTIETYSLGQISKDSMAEFIQEGLGMALNGASEDEIDSLLNEIITRNIENASKDFKQTIALSFTKTDEGWKIDRFEDNSIIVNAITGGMSDFANEMGNALSGLN